MIFIIPNLSSQHLPVDSYSISCYRSYGRADEFVNSIKSDIKLYFGEYTPNDEKEKIVNLYAYDIEENILFLISDILEYFSDKDNTDDSSLYKLRQENKIADFVISPDSIQMLYKVFAV